MIMGTRDHHSRVTVRWTGNLGSGTAGYGAYSRNHEIRGEGKPPIAGSSDPVFRGDADRYNPEELFVASLAACHELWFLHLCADAGIVVTAYEDEAEGWMQETADGGGRFVRVRLRPRARIEGVCGAATIGDIHQAAHKKCFLASSVNFPVEVPPEDLQ